MSDHIDPAHEWFCTKCSKVFGGGFGQCCGGQSVPFDPFTHWKKLIGASNSWTSVWSKWRDDPRLRLVAEKLNNDGCHAASSVLNKFIETLSKHDPEPILTK